MTLPPSAPERCRLLLNEWRNHLRLTNLEKDKYAFELKGIDNQITYLFSRKLRIVVYGRVGVGKSSLLNALLEENIFPTDISNGHTRLNKRHTWNQNFKKLNAVEFIDTPGIEGINLNKGNTITTEVALQADLILYVLDSDLTKIDKSAIEMLSSYKKPFLLILNRCDQWSSDEVPLLINSIKSRLPLNLTKLPILSVASAPRSGRLHSDGTVRSVKHEAKITPLREFLIQALDKDGELLLALNTLKQADQFSQLIKKGKLKRRKSAAQGLIGKFATLKASGIALNPLGLVDVAAGIAFDTALIIELSKLYELQLGGPAARHLMQKLSIYNSLLGGMQITIQLILSSIRQLLLLSTPFTGGLSLAPSAPIALLQAALSVHTTRVTGRLAAKELLKDSCQKNNQPAALLNRLERKDPQVKLLLNNWGHSINQRESQLQTLLP